MNIPYCAYFFVEIKQGKHLAAVQLYYEFCLDHCPPQYQSKIVPSGEKFKIRAFESYFFFTLTDIFDWHIPLEASASRPIAFLDAWLSIVALIFLVAPSQDINPSPQFPVEIDTVKDEKSNFAVSQKDP